MYRFHMYLMPALLTLSVACSESTQQEAKSPSDADSSNSPATATATSDDADNATPSHVAISDEIRKKCGLSETETYFAYNSAVVNDRGSVLHKLVECFERGPMKGQKMLLVGHADPRGDEEYNLTLAGRRADNVKAILVKVGLQKTTASTSSRGEMDASGIDESGWAKDRRVDVTLDRG